MLSSELLELLKCPYCSNKLEYYLKKEVMACRGCHEAFPVENGVPILIRKPTALDTKVHA